MTVVTIATRERKSDVDRRWCKKLGGSKILLVLLRGTILICSFVSIGMFGYILGQHFPIALSVDNYNSSKHNSPHLRRTTTSRKTDSSTPSTTTAAGDVVSSAISLEARKTGTKTWSMSPPNWEDMTFKQLRSYYACHEHARNPNKPLPTIEEWMFLKKQYRELVDDKAWILDSPVEPTNGFSHGTNDVHTNIPPPYYAGQSDGKGRGLFSSRNINKGELVHDGPRSSVAFPDALSYRRLIINLPRNTACDVTEWAWTQQLAYGGEMKIVLDLNIAALMNSSNEPNIGPMNKYTTKMYALRDIKQGEEILHDYSVYTVEYEALGL